MATDWQPEARKGDNSPLPANVVVTSPDAGLQDLQDVNQYSIQATKEGANALVTGSLSPHLLGDAHNESDQQAGDPQQKQKRTRVICTCFVITFLLAIPLGIGVSGGVVYQTRSSGNKESDEAYIAYQGDATLLAEVNEASYKVSVQQMCPGSGGHTIELYLAPTCDLKPHCFNVNSEATTVNSTRSPTITEVHFKDQSHIYMTSSSNITFFVEIATPMANTSLVIFNNYTYFTDFVLSDNPSTDKALLVHLFQGQRSSYTLQGETNTYFAAFESLDKINFTFRYSGNICNYLHSDYKKSECDLPASTCQQKICTFEYKPHNKTCILGYVPPSVTHPTFAYLLVETYQRISIFKHRTVCIVLLSLFSVFTGVLVFVSVVYVIVVAVVKLTIRSGHDYERVNNN